jgi:hypothetical protein
MIISFYKGFTVEIKYYQRHLRITSFNKIWFQMSSGLTAMPKSQRKAYFNGSFLQIGHSSFPQSIP